MDSHRVSKDATGFRDVYSYTKQFLGAVYPNHSARKWPSKSIRASRSRLKRGASLVDGEKSSAGPRLVQDAMRLCCTILFVNI